MSNDAAHLVDEVFPDVPVRQWVLSFPYRIRYLLAYDPKLLCAVRSIFVRSGLRPKFLDRARISTPITACSRQQHPTAT